MTLNDPYPSFKVTPFFDAEYFRNGTTYRHSVIEILVVAFVPEPGRKSPLGKIPHDVIMTSSYE